MTIFGRSLRDQWYLDPDLSYLNHWTVGAPPKAVVAEQFRLMEEIERQRRGSCSVSSPTPPVVLRSRPASDEPRRRSPRSWGSTVTTCSSSTTSPPSANSVLRSFPFSTGHEIVVTSLGYGGITLAATYAARTNGCELRTIELPGPGAAPHEYVERIEAGLGPASRVLVVDHIAANAALVLPLREIAEVCHRNGTLVLADGAHVPGNIALDIESLGVDWYTGNLHKWAWTPRSSGILWAAPERRSDLHPAVISWGLDNGLTAEFDLLGTRDPTPHLVAPFAIELMHSYGEGAVLSYNHGLAWWAGQYLSDLWGTTFSTPEEMIGAMVAVRLPDRFGDTTDDAARLQSELEGRGVIVPVTANPYGLTLRVSAQAYCDRADIERLGEAVLALR
ncbi:MAG: aminotransferase class V-fold PLP-dependent enzyme [Ilumatobacteraceae bacterium]